MTNIHEVFENENSATSHELPSQHAQPRWEPASCRTRSSLGRERAEPTPDAQMSTERAAAVRCVVLYVWSPLSKSTTAKATCRASPPDKTVGNCGISAYHALIDKAARANTAEGLATVTDAAASAAAPAGSAHPGC